MMYCTVLSVQEAQRKLRVKKFIGSSGGNAGMAMAVAAKEGHGNQPIIAELHYLQPMIAELPSNQR